MRIVALLGVLLVLGCDSGNGRYKFVDQYTRLDTRTGELFRMEVRRVAVADPAWDSIRDSIYNANVSKGELYASMMVNKAALDRQKWDTVWVRVQPPVRK